MRTTLVGRPIDVAALTREVGAEDNGAISLFVGTVRNVNEGRAVDGIEYNAYAPMAERELAQIAEEASARFGTRHIVIEHRTGYLALGEASVVIAVGHPRRAPSLDGARWIIEELKRRVPIWKLEHYVDGTREWVAQLPTGEATADA
ncbi:MAG: molybdenum cofactor biosynthesis protein MoaE [Gemmatimonadota bacterium]|nr:molybdenum cofactor biosynthesis protein MoaE [Gemmatimonadota bacterium]